MFLSLLLFGNLLIHSVAGNSVSGYFQHSATGAVTGELKKWHRVTVGFDGPFTNEQASFNPFLKYRLTVEFTHVTTGVTYAVPGFYAADGQAAHTSASSGNVWLCHFSPDAVGEWDWSAEFVQGNNIAVNGLAGTSAGFFDGATGSFTVAATDKDGVDLRGKGRLQYVGEHHLQFAETGEYFFKAGTDSPENFLAYSRFDNTPNFDELRKNWNPHRRDFVEGDPSWKAGELGRGIIGAINYLSEMGMRSISFLTLTSAGDDRNVFPFVSDDASDFDRYDVSKTAQWEIVLEHAEHKGMFLHFKTQEHENDQLLDDGGLGFDRKLYYRELIARFGHHAALNWNLGEENTNTVGQRNSFIDYIRSVDPYNHPIVMHTRTADKIADYTPLLGNDSFEGASLQSWRDEVYNDTTEWLQKSGTSGHKWIVSNDEQNPEKIGVLPDSIDFDHDNIRKDVLWGNLMAGGAGVEYYFGYDYIENDVECEDFRSREQMWYQSRFALDFLDHNQVPFWKMSSSNHLLYGGVGGTAANPRYWSLATTAAADATIVLYLKRGGTVSLKMSRMPSGSCSTSYSIGWFNPREGGPLQFGDVTSIPTFGRRAIGIAPSDTNKDWVVLLQCADDATLTDIPSDAPLNAPTKAPTVLDACGVKDFQNECTTTGGCNDLYFGASDCSNSHGGVCFCDTAVCGCMVDSDDATLTGSPTDAPTQPPTALHTCGLNDFQNECTTTRGCRDLYSGASDCSNSEGGVCFCGTTICGCLFYFR